ncbi:hypothetical protein H5P28_17845 [Ruficoccus amylovorans]|uniref:Uncharacterized protein n=1 Tax=Ruficoccus amylovorans TaxID=1804625 RepID=A0A842HHC4_9BACT|nr:hypothetical protein [Ruficoccus amylovorans]MBC2596135.1 hypothetical protein [Ruficoccus amylovorans]
MLPCARRHRSGRRRLASVPVKGLLCLLGLLVSGAGQAQGAGAFDPFGARIEAADGREVMARIVGHDGKVLRFVPLHQEREYAVPFEQLSTATREQILEHCPTSFLQLDENWDRKNSHAGLDNTTIRDLVKLLGLQLGASSRLRGFSQSDSFSRAWLMRFNEFEHGWLYGDRLDRRTYLFDGIYYLDPLQEVRHRLYDALEIGRSQAVVTDGFPENSFRLWVFPVRGEYRNAHGYDTLALLSGYNAIALMVDRKDQVVAVECLRTSNVGKRELPRPNWEGSTIHFLGLKKKFAADATVLIHTKEETGTRSDEGVHMTEVMFYSSDKRPLSYSRMYMPDGLARIIAYNIYTNWQ